jgi:hypothetical protein
MLNQHKIYFGTREGDRWGYHIIACDGEISPSGVPISGILTIRNFVNNERRTISAQEFLTNVSHTTLSIRPEDWVTDRD